MACITIENVGPRNDTRLLSKKYILWKLACLITLFFISSCSHSSNTGQDDTTESAYKPPVVQPLVFTNQRKINWAKTTTRPFSPTTISLDINKLPVSSYADTNDFKPFSKPVDTERFGSLNSFPQKSFDVSKLPSRPLIYHNIVLKAPQIIKAGPPRAAGSPYGSLYTLNDAQGLEGQVISCLYNDHNGFLWIASEKGVYRYDGQNLVRYITDPLRTILCMVEDSSGRIWMGSQDDGLAVFDPKTGEYSVFNEKQGITGSKAFFILTDKNGRLWAGGITGSINIIDPKNNTISHLDERSGLFNGNFGDIVADADQNIWVLSANGLGVIDLKNNKISDLSKLHALQSMNGRGALFCDSRNNIWVSSSDNGSLAMIDMRNNQAYTLHETVKSKKAVTSFSEDLDGNICYSYQTSIKTIDMNGRRIKDIAIAKFDAYVNNLIIETLTDKTGDTWIGTTFGLFFNKNNKLLVTHIGRQPIASVADDHNGLIYAGSNDGLRLIDRRHKISRLLGKKDGLLNDSVQNVVLLPDGKMDVNTNGGISIIDSDRRYMENFSLRQSLANIVDRTGKMWIGGVDGVNIYDPVKKTITHLGKENGIGILSDIMIDKNDNIWLEGAYGLFSIINPERNTIKDFDFNLPQRVNNIAVMLHDTGVNTWIGTPKGLFIINPVKKNLTRLGIPQGLIDETLISLLKRGNTTYIGTNKGVSAITGTQSSKWKIVSFGREYGLEKINVGYFMTDNITREGGYIWGDQGISILNLAAGIHHTGPAIYITGFNIMDEPAYFTEPVAGNTDSTLRYNVLGKVSGPYNLPADLELPYNKNSLQFAFTSSSTFKSDTTWYRYMLTGADKGWRNRTSALSTGNYFSLPPGRYTFKVSATANDGTWGKPAIFNFTILPPWWETWWARLIMLLLLAGVIRWIVDIRSRSLVRSKKILEQKVTIRTQEVLEQKEELAAQRDSLELALGELKQTQSQLIQSEKMASLGELTAGIAHEIQNPLNFVNNFSEVNTELIDELQEEIEKGNLEEVKAIAISIQENEKKISMHGKRADAIVKGMLQHSRAGSGLKEPTDINKLADEYLRLSYHGLRAKDKSFNAEMLTHFDEHLPLVHILPQEVGRVLLNLFNNAFYAVSQKKKTASPDYKPTVEVSTSLAGDNVMITVKDNGMGIPEAIKDKIMQPFFTTKPTGEGTGLGLSLSYDIIVKGHGGIISVDTKEGEFTEFIIQLP